MVRRADRRRRAVRADQHRGQGDRVRARRSASTRSSPRARETAQAHDAAPGHLLQDPGQLPARAAGARRARRRDPRLAGAPPAAQDCRSERMAQEPRVPDLARHLGRRHDHPARPEPGRRPDGQGRVRRADAVDGHPAPPDPVARCASSSRCSSRSPTTASRRPPSPPGSPTCQRPRLAAGRARRGPARRRLPVPRGDRGLPASSWPGCSPRRARSRPTTPASTRSRWRPCSRRGRRRSSSPASATRCTRSATRAPRC